jgi:hypothetical protein
VLFAVGAVLGFAGMITERSWLVNVGIVVLVIGVALRFLGRRDAAVDENDPIDDGRAAEDDPDGD